jgi:DNA mismatch repair ATPase MutS
MFNRKGKIKEKLSESFGKIKDDSFAFELIERYFKKKDKTEAFQVLSDKTCNDLDFNELFMFVDRTTSRVGQQCLYSTLRTFPSNDDKIESREKVIDIMGRDSGLRADLQLQLNQLAQDDSYYITSLFQDEHISEPKWFFIIPLLAFTSLLSILLLPFNTKMLFVLTGVFIINAGFHYWNKNNLYEYLGSIPQLLKLNSIAKVFLKNELFSEIDQKILDSIKVIDQIRNRMSFFKLSARLENDMEAIVWAFMEFFKILFLLEPLLLFDVLKKLDTKRSEIDNVFSFVGNIDSMLSIASLRHGLDSYCLPEIDNSDHKFLQVKDIYHPLIPDCVKNSIRVKDKSILLTGSNMSGKTSFIRTIGINAITGLTINTCFAYKFSMPRIRVYSAIRISDDLMNDKSYYFEEVLTIKDMIDKSGDGIPNLFLLDEIFKGTNTIERISAGKAVLSFLAKADNIVFVSTHDIELADLLKDQYVLYHFSEKVDHQTVDFDYKLKDGKLQNRNAIRILQINGYPDEIIKEAIELSKELDNITVTNNLPIR